MPAEERFAIGTDVGNEAFEGEYDGDAAKTEDEDEKTDQFARSDVGCVWLCRGEHAPRNNGAEVNEHAAIEEEVEDVR